MLLTPPTIHHTNDNHNFFDALRVALGTHHIFRRDGETFLILADALMATKIDESLAGLLENLNNEQLQFTEPQLTLLRQWLRFLKRNGDKASSAETKYNRVPITNIALFVNQECNFGCSYCYGDGGRYGSGGVMSRAHAIKAVDWLFAQSQNSDVDVSISFFGGEPLLSFELIKEIVEYANSCSKSFGKCVHYYMTTNASLLDDERIQYLKDHNVGIVVSFDGSKEIQDRQRPMLNGKSSYDSTVPKIRKLLKVLPNTAAQSVVVGNTDPHLIKDELKTLGFKKTGMSIASPMVVGDAVKHPDRDVTLILDNLENEAKLLRQSIHNRDDQTLTQLMQTGTIWRTINQFINGIKKEFYCNAGRSYAGVSNSGDVYLCHRFVGNERHRVGNIFGDTLDLDKYQTSTIVHQDKCATCYAKYTCGGGCYHDNYGKTGSDFNPEEQMCQVQRRTAELGAFVSSILTDKDLAYLVDKGVVDPPSCPLDLF